MKYVRGRQHVPRLSSAGRLGREGARDRQDLDVRVENLRREQNNVLKTHFTRHVDNRT